jgi:hypothetical protein
MGEVITLASGKEFRTLKDLQKYADTLYLIAETAQEKIKELEEKLKHTEDLLVCNPVVPIVKTLEQCIVEKQIDELNKFSMSRTLSNEEIKSLDILIKNKLLLSGQATTIPGNEKKKKDYTIKELTFIAQKKTD